MACQNRRTCMWNIWTHKLRGHDHHPLVAEVVVLVVVHALHCDDVRLSNEPSGQHMRAREQHRRWGYETHGICRGVTNGGHDGEEDMLLDGEGAGVEGDAKDLDVGEEAGPEAAEGEGQQLGDNLEGISISDRVRSAQQEGRKGKEKRLTPVTVTEG